MNVEQLSQRTGCDLQAALRRLGGMETLYERLINKFLDDRTFEELKSAMEAGDFPMIETKAHTLKGISANLGFETLSQKSDEIVKAVREDHKEQTEELFEECERLYERIVTAIQEAVLKKTKAKSDSKVLQKKS